MASQTAGYIGIIFGLIFLIACVWAANYKRIIAFGFDWEISEYPYKDYVFPLALLSILSFTAGIIILASRHTETKTDAQEQLQRTEPI